MPSYLSSAIKRETERVRERESGREREVYLVT